MIEGIKNWLWGIIAVSMCLALLYGLMPKGAVRSIGQISGGLVLLLVMLYPVLGIQLKHLEWHSGDYQEAIDRQIEEYRSGYEDQLRQSIEKETAAYISKKAAQMGVDCRIEVKAEEKADHTVLPGEVWLDTEQNTALQTWITSELGIAPERQHWEVEK